MNDKSAPRPGGRSARIQAAVHQAVRALQQEQGRDGLTVPAIASRAGVTPSTIYRRWGDLAQLLADVAVEQLQPEQPPTDTGSFRSDLLAWLLQYFDEMSSSPGRAMLRDVLGTEGHAGAGKCDSFVRQQIEAIRERALARGESPVTADLIIRIVVAPLMYRILFASERPAAQAVEVLFEQVMNAGDT
ncbi:TetR/AcrR family transcriptional regulator [Comamonas sp. Y6]|uniref:TetR/AcrR family transcriptional regulator n=1 Tax=Comamonas resistens TaxID=3046670 RepID=A0ABY8SM92_9BURK|nr:TetR/AcrR family transcriptional regulator [Comamonas resistens]MDL5038764.1 TetR/AcrR family transcriptional regulator [Comamonas resistens]WHS64180.1 TetR/AcrR family transcriptional regulator [Comamonas resistens]